MNDYIDRCNYYSDGRVRAGRRADDSPIRKIDEKRMLATIVLEDDDGEMEHEVPCKYEMCPTCDGKGSHVNPSVDAGGLSAQDFYEDPDFAKAYIGGVYDVPCYECRGKRVVAVLNRDRMEPTVLKQLEEFEESMADFRRTQEAERRFGC